MKIPAHTDADGLIAELDREGKNLHDALGLFGIWATRASEQRHYLHTEAGCIGHADATEGWNLVRLLAAVRLNGTPPS